MRMHLVVLTILVGALSFTVCGSCEPKGSPRCSRVARQANLCIGYYTTRYACYAACIHQYGRCCAKLENSTCLYCAPRVNNRCPDDIDPANVTVVPKEPCSDLYVYKDESTCILKCPFKKYCCVQQTKSMCFQCEPLKPGSRNCSKWSVHLSFEWTIVMIVALLLGIPLIPVCICYCCRCTFCINCARKLCCGWCCCIKCVIKRIRGSDRNTKKQMKVQKVSSVDQRKRNDRRT